jgi:hypothetical protein
MVGGADTCEGGAWATTDRGANPAKAAVPRPAALFLTGGAEYVGGGGRAGSDGCGCRLSLLLMLRFELEDKVLPVRREEVEHAQ